MKKKIQDRRTQAMVAAVILLPGCGGNVIDWGKRTFVQAKKQKDISKSAKNYAKQINVYDQLNTVALFDVLWLSDHVRMFYADMYAVMTGKNDEEKKVMLRRLFKANSTHISFYVLVPVSVVLAVKPIEWAVSIQVDDNKYQPVFIKKCEMPSQYQALFGNRYNAYKQAYEVKFDRYDANGNDILSPESEHILKFTMNSPVYSGTAQWNVSNTQDDLVLQLHQEIAVDNSDQIV